MTDAVGYTATHHGGIKIGYTTPVGFLTEQLHPGMNIIGLRLHQKALCEGSIGSLGKDFAEIIKANTTKNGNVGPDLIQGRTYILEITSGAKAGIIQEISQWQGLRLTLPDDIAAAGVKPGDHFIIRQAATLNSIFDPRSTGLQVGKDPISADNVLIPQGASFGDFRRCFITRLPDGTAAWLDAVTRTPVGDLPLVYPDGLIVHCKGPDVVELAYSGETKPGLTRSVVKPGLNLVATPFPAGGRLQKLGLENDLLKSDHVMEADKVWVSDGPYGHFTTYFLNNEGKWINSTHGDPVTEEIPVGSAILIERKGPDALFALGD